MVMLTCYRLNDVHYVILHVKQLLRVSKYIGRVPRGNFIRQFVPEHLNNTATFDGARATRYLSETTVYT